MRENEPQRKWRGCVGHTEAVPDELPADLARWCEVALGSPARTVLTAVSHLSQVYVVRLNDDREVVLKARPANTRVAACWAVQEYLHAAGFPCPQPLGGPDRCGPLLVTAEAYIGDAGPAQPAGARLPRSAQLLQQLVALAPAAGECAGLEPAPPWAGWDHDQPGTWPVPDDLDCDLNAAAGPAVIEDAGRRLRSRLLAASLPAVVGHLDWESHNLLWRGNVPAAVLDWDSIALRPEAAVAGAAAAVFPSLAATVAATIDQTENFLAAYQDARPIAFTPEEMQIAWAAGGWVLAFNARKESVSGVQGPYQRHLATEGPDRLRRAGA
jgi:hypothetical protein